MNKDKENRKKANEAILDKMARGESLTTVPVSMTWFPPRPVIKKDFSSLKGKPKSQSNLSYIKGENNDEDKWSR